MLCNSAPLALGKCITSPKKKYVAEGFGYILVNDDQKTVEIFKAKSTEETPVNIATCRIKDNTERHLTLSSLIPISYKELNFQINKTHSQTPDSLQVIIKLPSAETYELKIVVFPAVGQKENYKFSSDGTVKFFMKKYDFEYDNFFSVIVYPEINPFQIYSSWGRCQTLSFLDLGLDDITDITDSALSKLEIYIPNFTNEIFRKWVIEDDFVVKDNSTLIWRDIVFMESKEQP